MTLEQCEIVKREAFERWVSAKDDAGKRIARRELDAANEMWDKAFDAWAARVGNVHI